MVEVRLELDDDVVETLKTQAEWCDLPLEAVCKLILSEYARNRGGYLFYGSAPGNRKIILIQWPYITGQVILTEDELKALGGK
ncbi:MAG: hypothetical protein ACTSWP_03620 [Candidatus Freyarchaeota archaeon]|nr:hypothetical protein [Candidatus Freyrarchaeum guaymaensis]